MLKEIIKKIKDEIRPIDYDNWQGMSLDIELLIELNDNREISKIIKDNYETCTMNIYDKREYTSIQSLVTELNNIWGKIYYQNFQMSAISYYLDFVVLEGITVPTNNSYYFHVIIKINCKNFNNLIKEFLKEFGEIISKIEEYVD